MQSIDRDARVAGLLYLVSGIVGVFDLEYLPGVFIVHGNVAATASNIASHEFLFRIAMASDLFCGILWLGVVLALYRLLAPVDRAQAGLMLILGALLQVPFYFFNAVNYAAALLFVRGAGGLSTFTVVQRDAMATFFLSLHHYVVDASLVFAGLWLFPFAILVYKCGFLPRILGVWLALGGVGWLAVSFTAFLAPQYLEVVSNVTTPLTLGEVAVMLWLPIMGARAGFRRRRFKNQPGV